MQKICSKCLYPTNHPFGLTFNEQECSGCVNHREKDVINWDKRLHDLESLVHKYKRNGRKYDCIVPVTGDAEDFYTLSKVLSLGLSPLVVCVNDYFKNDIGWHNLHQLITHFDVDSFVFNPDIRVYKELVRTSLRKYNHVLLPFLQLHTSFPVHVAYERKIPLIIWGQNQSIEQVGKFSHHDAVQMSRWSRRQHDLFDVEIDDLIGNGAQVELRHLNYYEYPNVSSLARRGVTGIYLSNYFRWDPLAQNKSVVKFGFKPETTSSTFDYYERAGSSVYYQMHDLLKFKRVGYRKITDHVAREIRHKRISCALGEQIISKYNRSQVYIKPFFDWLGVTTSGYEWFMQHKLHGLKHLVTDSPTVEVPYYPSELESFITESYLPSKHHIIYGKGLNI